MGRGQRVASLPRHLLATRPVPRFLPCKTAFTALPTWGMAVLSGFSELTDARSGRGAWGCVRVHRRPSVPRVLFSLRPSSRRFCQIEESLGFTRGAFCGEQRQRRAESRCPRSVVSVTCTPVVHGLPYSWKILQEQLQGTFLLRRLEVSLSEGRRL